MDLGLGPIEDHFIYRADGRGVMRHQVALFIEEVLVEIPLYRTVQDAVFSFLGQPLVDGMNWGFDN